MTISKPLICFLFIAIASLIIVHSAEATSLNFTVFAGEEETKTINLAVDDHVLIKVTVPASSDIGLYFSVTYPNGTVEEFGKGGYFTLAFVCDVGGQCVLHFSNVGSTEDKFVVLDYEIEHYIFGIPQMFFLVMIVAVICVAAVAVFILMGKPR
jgi:hypothetical protein